MTIKIRRHRSSAERQLAIFRLPPREINEQRQQWVNASASHETVPAVRRRTVRPAQRDAPMAGILSGVGGLQRYRFQEILRFKGRDTVCRRHDKSPEDTVQGGRREA